MSLLVPGVIASCGVSDLTVTGSGDAGAGGVSGGSAGAKAHSTSGGTAAALGHAGEIGEAGASNGGSGVADGGSSVASGGTGVTSGGTGVTSGGTGVTSKAGAGSGGASCPDLQCDGACFNSQTSNVNCGTCGNACTSDQSCKSGSCACNTAGFVVCPRTTKCIDTNTSTDACGACDHPCGPGLMCSGGTCKAPPVCDVLAAAGNPCVAAHSTTRVMVSGYTGPLYQVCLGSYVSGPSSCTGTTKNIGSIGGVADSAAQDAFCGAGVCTISIIYDQTTNKNDLQPAPGGGANSIAEYPASATALKTTLAGHTVYGVLIQKLQAGNPPIPGTGYRRMIGVGTATGDQPESEYMVTSQKDLYDGCCFEYGNAETNAKDDGAGAAEAVYFGGGVVWGTGFGGKLPGPWVEADLEDGLYAGWEDGQDKNISTNDPLKYDFVTAILVGDTADKNAGQGRFALFGGDATSGGVQTMYDGVRPAAKYAPMKKEGGIILGIGGDNSNAGTGRWYEGVMSTGAWTSVTVGNVAGNVALAGYGK